MTTDKLGRIAEALRPLSDAVFNDNGDMTVNIPSVSAEDCIKAYFAEKHLAALTAPEAKSVVAVESLVWRTFCSHSGNCSAQSAVGEYVIQNEDGLWMIYLPYKDTCTGKGYDAFEAAKAAAQADYETRIRSALVDSEGRAATDGETKG